MEFPLATLKIALNGLTSRNGKNAGIAKDYGRLAPPMPTYNMTQDDARAVYKYLKSLEH
jgi:hypothetical protein